MLYTVVSEYDVFLSNSAQRNYLDIKGGKLEYIGSGKNRKIVGLFSTDPSLYLIKDYQPGQRIRSNNDNKKQEDNYGYFGCYLAGYYTGTD